MYIFVIISFDKSYEDCRTLAILMKCQGLNQLDVIKRCVLIARVLCAWMEERLAVDSDCSNVLCAWMEDR